MFEHETSAQIGAGLTCAKCSFAAVISGSSVQSLQSDSQTAETTGRELIVAFWPKHDLRVSNFKNFPGGACPQTPLAS